jgi:trigger factor
MTIEVLDGLKRKATILLKKSELDNLTQAELKKYTKQAKAPGFRPGKVPINIVEQMYGFEAYQEVLQKTVDRQFFQLVNEHKLKLAGRPEFNMGEDVEGDNINVPAADSSTNEDISVVVTFEVMPDVTLGNLSNETIKKPVCVVGDEQVEKIIENLRIQRADYIEDETKLAASGDRVVIDFSGSVDGVKFDGGSAENYEFLLGNGQMLPDFEQGIIGLKTGETKDIDVRFPDNYQAENLKGKTAIFTITAKKISSARLPELTEEFVQGLGVNDGTIDSLKKEIKQNVEREVTQRLKAQLRDNAFAALAKVSPIEVPHSMVHDEVHHLMDNAAENMKKRGYSEDMLKKMLTHSMFESEAKKIVVTRLLVMKLISDNQLKVTPEEVKLVVEDMASMYEDSSEYITWYYQDAKRIEQAENYALEQKVIEHILSQAQVSEMTMTYDDLMKAG